MDGRGTKDGDIMWVDGERRLNECRLDLHFKAIWVGIYRKRAFTQIISIRFAGFEMTSISVAMYDSVLPLVW